MRELCLMSRVEVLLFHIIYIWDSWGISINLARKSEEQKYQPCHILLYIYIHYVYLLRFYFDLFNIFFRSYFWLRKVILRVASLIILFHWRCLGNQWFTEFQWPFKIETLSPVHLVSELLSFSEIAAEKHLLVWN